MWFMISALAASPTSTTCDVEAYVTWQAGKVGARDVPDGKPTGVLVAERADGDLSDGPRVHIVAWRPGWFQVDRVEEAGDSRAWTAWIPTDAVRIDLAMSAVSPALAPPWTVPLRVEPKSDATVVRGYVQESHTTKLLGCSGTWFQAEVTVPGEPKPTTGWLAERHWCANALSTCATKGGAPPTKAAAFDMTFRVPGGEEARAGKSLGVFLSFENTSEQEVEVKVSDVGLFARSPEARPLSVNWSMKSVALQPGSLGAVFGTIALPAGEWHLEAVHSAGPVSSATFVVQP